MYKEKTRYCDYRRHQPKAFGNDKSLSTMVTLFAVAFTIIAAGYLISVIPSENDILHQRYEYAPPSN